MSESPNEATSHEYNHLPKGFIRLLELEAGDGSTPLAARFLETDVTNPCSYTALSYVWGSGVAVDTIVLNQFVVLPVRPNLHRALCALRRKDVPTVLWVDAICIDQAKIEERNDQVRLMTDIYRNAREVVAWLGEENDATESDIHSLQVCDERFKGKAEDPLPRFQAIDGAVARCMLFKDVLLTSILKSPWFRRMWILQEAIVNRNLTFRSGTRSFQLDSLVRCIAFYHNQCLRLGIADATVDGGEEDPPIPMILNLFKLRHMFLIDGEKPGLRQLLRLSKASQATDAKDYIFALLGIAKDTEVLGLVPNYDQLWGNVHVRAAEALLDQYGLMTVVAYKGITLRPLPSPYPSWIPEWYDPNRIESFMSKSQEASEVCGIPLYKAGSRMALETGIIRGTILHLTGRLVDTIIKLEEGVREHPFLTTELGSAATSIELGRFQNWVAACVDIAKSCVPYPSSGGVANAMLRTLIADSTPNLVRAPPIFVGGLLSWLEFDDPESKKMYQELISRFTELYIQQHSEAPKIVEIREMTAILEWLWSDLKINAENFIDGILSYFITDNVASDTNADLGTEGQDEASLEGATHGLGTSPLVALTSACRGRVFCATGKKYVGLVPFNAQLGDSICVLPGASTPFVLRREGDTFRFVGDCYIHGLMDGEVVDLTYVPTTNIVIE